MKKLSLYALFGVFGLMMASCDEDFKDWADPQSNAPESAITIPGITATGVSTTYDLANAANAETIKAFTLSTATLPEGFELGNARIVLTPKDAENTNTTTLDATLDGAVSSTEMQSLIESIFGKRPTARTFDMHVYLNAIRNGGDAVYIDAGTSTLSAIPIGPEIDEAYYIVGTVNEWDNNSTAYELSNGGADPYENPVFTITFAAPADGNDIKFKVNPKSGLGTWEKCLTASDTEGKFATDNAGGDLTITAVANAKYYRVTFNMMDQTWSYEGINEPELFLTGNNYSWGGTWLPLVPVWGTTDTFWKIIYLHADEEFKFAPQAGWGNDFGMEATINDVAGAGITNSGGNIKAANAGWYLLKVVNGAARTVDILTPNVYLIGETAPEGWNTVASGLFTIPTTEDGEFVSPAFVKDAEVRMCILLDGFDWWKTEFVVYAAGKIEYRGKDGDQTRYNVTAGQKAYLNFGNNTGSYK